jgi:hypothetical protein
VKLCLDRQAHWREDRDVAGHHADALAEADGVVIAGIVGNPDQPTPEPPQTAHELELRA